ncbi:hypothetical protein D9C73_027669 [Collichthys lucidus]|uniref:Uncharacterized protein n=1 Tax=Collichthys lucidus TaxID=240159 RepID=A0A4U5TU94_COLLU|nr:hypothetical protein D9C73_027669 [Collichthys lucidus]
MCVGLDRVRTSRRTQFMFGHIDRPPAGRSRLLRAGPLNTDTRAESRITGESDPQDFPVRTRGGRCWLGIVPPADGPSSRPHPVTAELRTSPSGSVKSTEPVRNPVCGREHGARLNRWFCERSSGARLGSASGSSGAFLSRTRTVQIKEPKHQIHDRNRAEGGTVRFRYSPSFSRDFTGGDGTINRKQGT